jgi:tetratricopeptide (TPR) repeat protein
MSPEPSSKIGKTVGEKLRTARIAQRFTQSQLAAPDFSVSYISAIERGQIHPSLRALEILAGRLGLTSTQLLPNRSQAEERHGTSVGVPEREDDEMDLQLLEVNILIQQGGALLAIDQLNKLSTKRLKREQHLAHRYLLGLAHYRAGQFQASEYVLTEALQLAQELNHQFLMQRILHFLALTYAAMRNYPQAILSHQRCLMALESSEPQDPLFIGQVRMDLGLHYTHIDNITQALEMFYKALEVINEHASSRAIQTTYLDISQQYAALKQYEQATHYAYKCLYLSDEGVSKRLQSELYYYLSRAVLNGDQEQARSFLDEALEQRAIQQDQLARASIYAADAEWYFRQQELDQAEQKARQALELAQPCGDTMISATTYIILGRIEYAQKREEQGDIHFVNGLSILERLGQHEELADESVQYAQLLEACGKEREAFAYFRRAFQSRQKIGK